MARRYEDWNVGLAEDLRDPEFAREFYWERSRRDPDPALSRDIEARSKARLLDPWNTSADTWRWNTTRSGRHDCNAHEGE
jgi:hypothetical protein